MKTHTNIKLLTVLFFSFLIFTSLSCKKNKQNILPEATQEGKNTFGCKVDGEIFVGQSRKSDNFLTPDCEGARSSITILKDDSNNNYFFVKVVGSNCKDKSMSVGVNLSLEKIQVGKYDLNFKSIGARKEHSGDFLNEEIPTSFITNMQYNGSCELKKIDTITNIISGTFSFKAFNGEDSVNVTDGRFDIKIKN
ncbi:MAG: hypothetical protein ACJAZ3_002048 [Sphingobacteriales bacterium]|jgi:hypothetical protein